MNTLITDLVRIQLAICEGWINAFTHIWQSSQHVWLSNLQLMRHPAFHRWHYVVPSGADWMNHYGHRHQDIDIEHMR